jgi:putative membrane protein insertion efficiency factor
MKRVRAGSRPLLFLLALPTLARAAEPFGPFETVGHPVTADAARKESSDLAGKYGRNPLYFAFDVYRRVLTKVDGPACAHRPTCSMYAMQAVSKHGLFLGGWLTANRLLRGVQSSGARDLARLPDGHYADPLSDATFWFEQKK